MVVWLYYIGGVVKAMKAKQSCWMEMVKWLKLDPAGICGWSFVSFTLTTVLVADREEELKGLVMLFGRECKKVRRK